MADTILTLAEQYWTGALSPEVGPPYAPLMAIEELAPGIAFVSSFANLTAITTDDGLILADTGGHLFAPQAIDSLRTWSKAPLHTAVHTHGHIDHVAGFPLFEAEARAHNWQTPLLVAHEAVAARFDRYRLTAGYNACINERQFSMKMNWPDNLRRADVTYRDHMTLSAGGVVAELHHALGETDDHTWIYFPSRKLLCTGDLFIWAVPNAGNPQKVQRYPREWAAALRTMAACDAEILCPGHGVPIMGAARVRQALSDTAALLESLVEQTLARMNQGAPLDEILHSVRAPAHLLERPYLRPIYDEPDFIVRSIWRRYGGWWDGDPSSLKPAPQAKLAAELCALAGGSERLLLRAETLADEGEWALACHLAETAAKGSPTDEGIEQRRAAIYRRRSETETSLMARGIFRSAAERKKP